MTDKTSLDDAEGRPELTRFLEDWMELWREEMRAQSNDRDGMRGGMMSSMQAAMEMWRTAMIAWVNTSPPSSAGEPPHGRDAPPRAQAGVAAPDPRDAEIERLTRRVDELETRLARLEGRPRARSGRQG